MRRVEAEFRPRWRAGRATLPLLSALGICLMLSIGAAVWTHQRVVALRAQVAELEDDNRKGVQPPLPRVVPPYDASARLFLRERGAGWAPMLRTLESGAMVGVTPTSVEFNATDGSTRVELKYSDSAALLEYLSRINEGVSPDGGQPRWNLVETRVQPGGGGPNALLTGVTSGAESVATIRSTWLDPHTTSEASGRGEP
jgi:hypothetical protein